MVVVLLFRQHRFLNKVCVVFQMTTLAHPKRLNVMETYSAGKIGSVGDAHIFPRLAQSAPDLPINMDQIFSGRDDIGSTVTPQPYTYDSNWNMGRGEQTAYGLMQQDLRAPDKLHEPTLGSIPQYQWRNKLATVYEAKRTGDKFLPLPGTYAVAPGEMVRGGQVVRTTDIEGLYSVVENQQESPSVGLARDNDALFRKQRMQNTKKNFTMSSPMVSNVPQASLNSSSGNFSLMDPKSITSATPKLSIITNVPKVQGPLAPTLPTNPRNFNLPAVVYPNVPKEPKKSKGLTINTNVPKVRGPRAPTRSTFPPIDTSNITAANIIGRPRRRRRE